MSGPPAEPATGSQASRRHAGRRSLPPSISLVAAAVAPRGSSHVKPAAAYTTDVSPSECTASAWAIKALRRRRIPCRDAISASNARAFDKREDVAHSFTTKFIMTVCIAAICYRLGYIVEVSDQLISSDETSADAVLKTDTLVPDVPWMVMYAGNAANYKRLLARIKSTLGDGKLPSAVISAVEEAYRVELLKIHETEVLNPYGMSRDDFFAFGKERFTEYKFNAIVDVLEQTHTDVSLMIAGYDERGDGHIYEASCWGVVKEQPLDFHAIGSGRSIALGTLYPIPDFARSEDFIEVVYRLCAAKFSAESTPTVGTNTFLFALARGGGEVSVMSPEDINALRDMWRNEGQPPIPNRAIELLKEHLLILNTAGETVVRRDPEELRPHKEPAQNSTAGTAG